MSVFEARSEPIPLPAFAFWTIIGAAAGIVLARLLRDRRRFAVVTIAGTGLSLIPAITPARARASGSMIRASTNCRNISSSPVTPLSPSAS
jgi:hypothetical protein